MPQINYQIFFQIISLLFSISGTVILAIPLLKEKHNIDDDEIIKDYRTKEDGQDSYFYTRKGFLKDRKLGLIGLGLLFFGFIFNFISIFINQSNPT